jgi:hypothetical protein
LEGWGSCDDAGNPVCGLATYPKDEARLRAIAAIYGASGVPNETAQEEFVATILSAHRDTRLAPNFRPLAISAIVVA